jgi:hypothetical protein
VWVHIRCSVPAVASGVCFAQAASLCLHGTTVQWCGTAGKSVDDDQEIMFLAELCMPSSVGLVRGALCEALGVDWDVNLHVCNSEDLRSWQFVWAMEERVRNGAMRLWGRCMDGAPGVVALSDSAVGTRCSCAG